MLVCDVGGGTSDFTLIRVSREGDRVDFTRTAVGKHLLLGGDNLDLTLAWLVEAKLGKTLSIRQRSGLRRQCAAAKERLLSDPNLKSVEITVLGGGLVAGRRNAEDRDHCARKCWSWRSTDFCRSASIDEKPKEEEKSLFRELGLPYVSDPAVTRHLAAFLASAGDAPSRTRFCSTADFLFRKSAQRVADVMEHWYGRRPVIFENRDLDLAVAVGAAYYSYVQADRRGTAGARRAAARLLSSASAMTRRSAWCRAAPKKVRRSKSIPGSAFGGEQARVVPSVQFADADRRSGRARRCRVPAKCEDLHLHAPLNAVIRFGKAGERLVPVKLGAHLTEVGTLEIWADSKDQRASLAAAVRAAQDRGRAELSKPAAVVSEEALAQAEALDPCDVRARRSRPKSCRRSWNRRWGWAAIRGR